MKNFRGPIASPAKTAIETPGSETPGSPWAVCLARPDFAGAGRLRQEPEVEVCESAESIWLRGPSLREDLAARIAAIPGATRFFVLPDGQLRTIGHRVPKGRIPSGPWIAIADWMGISVPPAGLAGTPRGRVPLVLVRSDRPEEPSVLLVRFDAWFEYAAAAPQVRLDRWQFAVAEDARVVIRGRPLPPIPGEVWVEREGIAVPAGWSWLPAVEPAIVRESFQLEKNDLALWRSTDVWERVPAAGFVRATRAAVRASAGAWNSPLP